MLLFFNILLICALTILVYKYISLRELFIARNLPDCACLEAVSKLIDTTEGYKSPHAAEMAKHAQILGNSLGLDERTLVSLRIAAFMHDCGQFNLSREIIRKYEPLTPEEWDLIKTHPIIGDMLLRQSLPLYEDIPGFVRWHHEKWDGSGYPDRLRGEEIPLPARILAVVDAVSAMSQDRPYRAAFSTEQIEVELERLSGLHFDPIVVKSWICYRRSNPTQLFPPAIS